MLFEVNMLKMWLYFSVNSQTPDDELLRRSPRNGGIGPAGMSTPGTSKRRQETAESEISGTPKKLFR